MLVEGSYKEGCMPNSLAGHLVGNRGGFVALYAREEREQTGSSSWAPA